MREAAQTEVIESTWKMLCTNGKKSRWVDSTTKGANRNPTRVIPKAEGPNSRRARLWKSMLKPKCKKSKAKRAGPDHTILCTKSKSPMSAQSTIDNEKTNPTRAKPKRSGMKPTRAKLCANKAKLK